MLHSNLWLPARAGERPWRSETIGVGAKKKNEYFCARRDPQVGFLVLFVFTANVFFDLSNCTGPLGACL